ncbi:MAG: zinc-ribbon and DUF3426 domain-containing protein [Lysobacterales bacterium]
MYTQCPDCLTVYRVGPDPVASGRGRLRCGHCGTVFDALATLTESLPVDSFQTLPLRLPSGVPPVLDVPAMHPRRDDPTEHEGNEARLPGEWLAAPDLQELPSLHADAAHFPAREPGRQESAAIRPRPIAPVHSPRMPTGPTRELHLASTDAPRVARSPIQSNIASAPPARAWAWGSVLLGVLLVLQVAWAERQRWWSDARVRPWLEATCESLGCTVPLPVSIDGLRLLAREVRPHEHLSGALVISGTLKNESAVVAPFPIVEVRLANLNDQVVAMRRFRPEEYLADPDALRRGFPGQSSLPLLFEVADPGQDALAFEFDFLSPGEG